MINGKKIVVVLPAYNAQATLRRTFAEIPFGPVDDALLVDDASGDATVDISLELGLKTFVHHANLGYGANQKTCYKEALALGADVVAMLHPDYQYAPGLLTALAAMVASGTYDVSIGSRLLGRSARAGGMPLYKYVANRCLTSIENACLGTKLSEFHTGYRAFARRVLESLPLLANSDDFVFDNETLAQAIALGFSIGEISCPTKYFPEASSISLRRSVKYGFGVLRTSVAYGLRGRREVFLSKAAEMSLTAGNDPRRGLYARVEPTGSEARRGFVSSRPAMALQSR